MSDPESLSMEKLLLDKEFRRYQNKAIIAYYLRTRQNVILVTGIFEEQGVPRSRVLDVIRKYKKTGRTPLEPQEHKGRSVTVATEANIEAVRKLYTEEPNTSLSVASTKIGIKKGTLRHILLDKLKMKTISQGKNQYIRVFSEEKKKKDKTKTPQLKNSKKSKGPAPKKSKPKPQISQLTDLEPIQTNYGITAPIGGDAIAEAMKFFQECLPR
ncbi:hypothetical protein HDE_07344 [Halotydeus destructor]|nr:hypothetical protein HDE_07344 [Halotydeus destructor]